MPDDGSDDLETAPFPGYENRDATATAEAGIPGLRPLDLGQVVVTISYSGTKVLVDIHVKKIAMFAARDFSRMQLYPGHLSDSATLAYSILKEKITVTLEAVPAERVVVMSFSGSKTIVSHMPSKPVQIPYMDGPYPFPDVSGLRHPRSYTRSQVEKTIAGGVWHDQRAGLGAPAEHPDGKDLITMLGGGPWLEDVRATFDGLGFSAPEADTGLDVLIAIGVRSSAESVLVVDGGFGFFYKHGLSGPDYVGLFTMGHTGIGAALEFSAELTSGLYWGSADRSQTALEAFGSVNAFIRVSAGGVVEAAVDFVVSGSPHLRLCGLNFGAGVGAGFSVAAGVQGVGEVHVGH